MKKPAPAIEIKKLSKKYNISHEQRPRAGTGTIRDAIQQTFRKPIELFTGHVMDKEEFWALRNIDLEIETGDVVGIIGRNGSGKSTLLKILSRIVEPTSGEAILRGRVASLLEVGTGFHPELTGRENVYFNGAILGMRRREIEAKFDEIVAFSEVEKFLDTPVKFYSSGMYVRLAFAVAAHLEPDILIVDEVLAVGDNSFQKKSLGKMREVAGQGRTVIFVSHSMDAIQRLCNKAVFLENGLVRAYDKTSAAIVAYEKSQKNNLGFVKYPENSLPVGVRSASLLAKGKPVSSFSFGAPVSFRLEVEAREIVKDFVLAVGLSTAAGFALRTIWSRPQDLSVGMHTFELEFSDQDLATGNYQISIGTRVGDKQSENFDGTLTFGVIADRTLVDKRVQDMGPGSGIFKNQLDFTIGNVSTKKK